MKASLQYNDFFGTSAASIADDMSLEKFLQSRGVDTRRYEGIGAKINTGSSGIFSVSFICIDKEKFNDGKNHIVAIEFENGIGNDEFFGLFKRFQAIIGNRPLQDLTVNEEIVFEDRIDEV